MNTNTCTHTTEIARAMAAQYYKTLQPETIPDWDSLTENEREAWTRLSGNILPLLGRHALEDLLAYTRLQLAQSKTAWPKILWTLLTGAVLAALTWLGLTSLTSCGHTIDASREDGLLICKDGTCLIIRDGRVTLGPAPRATAEQGAPAPITPQK